jgi:hypothetical protein
MTKCSSTPAFAHRGRKAIVSNTHADDIAYSRKRYRKQVLSDRTVNNLADVYVQQSAARNHNAPNVIGPRSLNANGIARQIDAATKLTEDHGDASKLRAYGRTKAELRQRYAGQGGETIDSLLRIKLNSRNREFVERMQRHIEDGEQLTDQQQKLLNILLRAAIGDPGEDAPVPRCATCGVKIPPNPQKPLCEVCTR